MKPLTKGTKSVELDSIVTEMVNIGENLYIVTEKGGTYRYDSKKWEGLNFKSRLYLSTYFLRKIFSSIKSIFKILL